MGRNPSTKSCVGETQKEQLRVKIGKNSMWTCGQKDVWADLFTALKARIRNMNLMWIFNKSY